MERTLWTDERIDDAMRRIDRRFDALEARMDRLDARMDRLEQRLDALQRQMVSFAMMQFVAMFGLLVTIIVRTG